MRWQVYTSLAYGMKGLLYYTYWTSSSLKETERFGIVNGEGRPTKHFPIIKQLNGEIEAIGTLLLDLTSTHVYHTGNIPSRCTRLPADLAVQVPQEQPLLLGLFEGPDDDEYVMIVNRDHRQTQEVQVRFKPHVIGVEEIDLQSAQRTPTGLPNHSFRIKFEPGAGRLFQLTTRFEYQPNDSFGS